MDSNPFGKTIPRKLTEKIATVLGITPDQVADHDPLVIVEELCDTALMCMDGGDSGDDFFSVLVEPVVKTASARLGPYRLLRLGRKRPCRIVLGASAHFPPGWIATELDFLNILQPEDWTRHFQKGSVDAMLAEHVWEHLTEEEGTAAGRVCFAYLRRGGYLRVAVPDGLHPDSAYIGHVKPGGSGIGADDHKVLYTYQSLRRVFEKAGFVIRLLEYFDEQGTFHFEDWSPRSGFINRSRRFDPRNQQGELRYTSIILDAVKPPDEPSG